MLNSYALRPAWTPLTIILMVIGFAFAWPVGLLILAYILFGDRISDVRRHFASAKRGWSRDFRGCGPRGGYQRSGNTAFDGYRDQELRRLDEERRKLDEERREFEGYVHDLRRARDQEEFDRFMRSRASRKGGESIDL